MDVFDPKPNNIPLWLDGAPFATGTDADDQPVVSLQLSEPHLSTKSAVIVCPGGGYGFLSNELEGRFPATWLNSMGISAFILRYRIAPKYHHPVPMLDIQRAIRTVRAHAAEWEIDPQKIGVWGFSAGAHLAATAGTLFDAGNPDAVDPIERMSSRPDFMILSYPVITMDAAFTHMGTRINLIGENPDPALIELLSTEAHVTSGTPPTFLFHTTTDDAVPVRNSVEFYSSLVRAGIPAEMHIYGNGPHGVNLAQFDPALGSWTELLKTWMRGRELVR